MIATAAPLYLEQKTAETLGLSRDEFRSIRRSIVKKSGECYEVERHTVLTQPALDRVLAYLRKHNLAAEARALDLSSCLFVGGEEKKEAADVAPELVTLTVYRLYPNPGLLRAEDPAGLLVDVRVPSNVNFRTRMTLRGRLVKPGFYEMEGRCPRFPGRY